ncbi:TetR/AcrR family transcriptional regulator [Microbacterium sp. NPDC089698]|uniref:TetR/AcrR family transcriptional regulator n=1 Tax=Microbacterium sp. NPDC089698 TaxID=3364200 RepID=UPI0038059DE1
MPRLIDHDERNRVIAAAATRVLVEKGLGALSVRNVAAEAGIAVASLRRAFPSQDQLRQFTLDAIRQAVARRISSLEGEGVPLVLALLREFLPLDETRRDELVAQLQLGGLALTDGSMQQGAIELNQEVRGVCVAALSELKRTGAAAPTIDVDFEVDRLHALLDGLAIHLLWAQASDPETVALGILDRHIRMLCANEDTGCVRVEEES